MSKERMLEVIMEVISKESEKKVGCVYCFVMAYLGEEERIGK